MHNRNINVTIYQEKHPTEDSPLATVRYTEYSDRLRSKVLNVNQVDYYDKEHFHSQVLQAVSFGLDVSISTQLSILSLHKRLINWTK